jgi:metallo-beta-lactamase family protein
MASIFFLGAAGTVTGSKHLLESNGRRILVDCGLYQGQKQLRLRNWQPLPVKPSEIDCIVLTHAHIDHTGYLPVVVRDGFRGRILATSATKDLSQLMLPDSGHLQEEEARFANKAGYSKHHPALPLYTAAQAEEAASRIETFEYGQRTQLFPGIAMTAHRAGHILGSATITFELDEEPRRHIVVFTGDLGRYDAPIITDPDPVPVATTLVVESTYGDRDHGAVQPREALCEAINRVAQRKGVIVIPAFAIGRTQEVLYDIHELEKAKRVPQFDVFVDSPMAIDATPIYLKHKEDHDEEMRRKLESGERVFFCAGVKFTRTVEESKRINDVKSNAIIISASGMATGGRVTHHLKQRLPDPNSTVLFVGYQAEGTRGRLMLQGAKEIKMLGEFVPVRAEILEVSGFSAHADRGEMGRWLTGFSKAPDRVVCVHGEPNGLQGMKQYIESHRPGWKAHVPQYLERLEL